MPMLYARNIDHEYELMKVVGHSPDIQEHGLQNSLPAEWIEVQKVWLYVEVHEESSKEIFLKKEGKYVRDLHTIDEIFGGLVIS